MASFFMLKNSADINDIVNIDLHEEDVLVTVVSQHVIVYLRDYPVTVFPGWKHSSTMVTMHTWEVTPGNKPQKIPQNSHLNGV